MDENGYLNQENMILQINVEDNLETFINKEIDENIEAKFNNWMHTSKTVYMNMLEQRDEFLTEKQNV